MKYYPAKVNINMVKLKESVSCQEDYEWILQAMMAYPPIQTSYTLMK